MSTNRPDLSKRAPAARLLTDRLATRVRKLPWEAAPPPSRATSEHRSQLIGGCQRGVQQRGVLDLAENRSFSGSGRSRGAIKTIQKGGGLRPTHFWMVLKPPGAAQTPKTTEFQPKSKPPSAKPPSGNRRNQRVDKRDGGARVDRSGRSVGASSRGTARQSPGRTIYGSVQKPPP